MKRTEAHRRRVNGFTGHGILARGNAQHRRVDTRQAWRIFQSIAVESVNPIQTFNCRYFRMARFVLDVIVKFY